MTKRTETYKNLGGDCTTSITTELGPKLRGKYDEFPERVVIENTHKYSEYPVGPYQKHVPYYRVTFEYNPPNPEIEDLKDDLAKLALGITMIESDNPGQKAFYSRRTFKDKYNRLKELEAQENEPESHNLNQLAKELHEVNVEKGFYDDHNVADNLHNSQLRGVVKRATNSEKLLLIISEITEIVEELREPNPDKEKIAEEYADVLIRLLDSVAANEVDIDAALEKKRKKNKRRAHMHGKRF